MLRVRGKHVMRTIDVPSALYHHPLPHRAYAVANGLSEGMRGTMPNDIVQESADAEIVVEAAVREPFFRRFLAWIILLLTGTVWGVTFSLAKLATETGANPLGISFWQSAIGAVCLVGYCIAFRQPVSLRPRNLLFYVACALLGSAVPNTLYFFAAPHVSAGVLSITVATVPIMTYLAAVLLRLEKTMIRRFLGVAFGMVAVLLIVSPDDALANPGSVVWVLATIIAAACYTSENMVIAFFMPSDVNSITVLTGMFVFAVFAMGPFVVLTDSFYYPLWPFTVVEWSVLAMAIISMVAYGFFIHLITIAGPVFASQMAYVVTLSGVFWGLVIFSEQHSRWIWAALAVMMLGLFLVTPKAREEIENVE